MTTDSEPKPTAGFAAARLPWLVGLAMLAMFLATRQPWLTVDNRITVSQLAGWNWRPNIFGALTLLVNWPLHWLPSASLPGAVNLLSALCGALTLGLLARSVAILPHDRTQEERDRLAGPSGVLTIRWSWLPPVFAVLVAGLTYSFWHDATAGNGALIDTLLFAYLFRCLLEFRLDRRAGWLYQFAFGYGVGVSDDWLFALLFPLAMVAVVWLKGLGVLNLRFLARMIGLGLLGLTLILILPLRQQYDAVNPIPFTTSMSFIGITYKNNLLGLPRGILALLGMTSVLPVVAMSVRWAPFSRDGSRLGAFLAQAMLCLVHGLLLMLCVWSAFDPRISPHTQVPALRSLPLYYLGALGIGYFTGFFLLVFGHAPLRRHPRPHPAVVWLNRAVLTGLAALALVAPLLLAARNLPRVSPAAHPAWLNYGAALDRSLPPTGSVIIADDPGRLLFLQAWLDRQGKSPNYVLIDSALLREHPAYFDRLGRQHPSFHLDSYLTNLHPTLLTNPGVQVNFLKSLAKDHTLAYLHPSFGYFFEGFYQQPHGLFYLLHPHQPGVLETPPTTAGEMAFNQNFWQTTTTEVIGPLAHHVNPPKKRRADLTPLERVFKLMRLGDEPANEEVEAAHNLSRALVYWGVTLQTQDQFPPASAAFESAQELNPDNVAAKINLDCNLQLKAGKHPPAKSTQQIQLDFGAKRSLDEILNQDGPLDEPNFSFQMGMICIHFGDLRQQSQWLVRQAVQSLNRACVLAPDQVTPRIWLAQLYEIYQHPTNELRLVEQVLQLVPGEPNALFLQANALMQMKAFDRAIPVLDQLLAVQTNNISARLNRGLSHFSAGNLASARVDYETVAREENYENRYRALYGLGEIAYRNKDFPTALTNYQLFLKSAPTNSVEFKQISDRVGELTAPGKP